MKLFRSITRLSAVIALACASNAGAGINSWTMTGPDAGAVNTIAIHPTNSQIALMSTPRGVYRTSNGGDSWTLVSEDVLSTVQSIAFDPVDPDRVFVAKGTLWRSDDAGETFAAVDDLSDFGIHTVAFTSAGTLYAHTRIGQVYRSTNQGVTWTACAVPGGAYSSSNAFSVDPNPNPQDHLFIDAHFGPPPIANIRGTYRSVDGCASWTVAGAGDPAADVNSRVNQYSVMPGNPNRVLAATNGGLSLSTDGGATWDYQRFSNTWWVQFDPTPAGNGHALAVMTGGTVLVSTDGGDNWIFRGSLYSLGDPKITFDPQIHGRVFGTTLHGAFLSTNGGASFALRASGVRAGVVGDFSTADDGTVYAVFNQGASGVFRRNPATQVWSPVGDQDLTPGIPGPLYMSHVATAPTNSSRLYAGIYTAFIVPSTDGGSSWGPFSPEFITPAASVIDTVVDPDDEQVAYTATSNRGIWKSMDGGASWTQLTNGVPLETWSVAAAPGSDVVYVAAGSSADVFAHAIHKSENGGVSWTNTGFPALPPNTGYINEIVIDPVDIDVVYATTGNGIYKTANGGTTWEHMSLPGLPTQTFYGAGLAIDPLHPTTLVASRTLFGAALARSVDGGASWQAMPLTLPGLQTFFDRVVLDPLRPNLIIASVLGANIGEYEVATDLSLAGPTLSSPLSTSTSFVANYNVQNLGLHGASPSELSIGFPTWATPTVPSSCTRAGQTLTCRLPPLNIGTAVDVPVTFAISAAGGTGALTANLSTHETDLVPGNNAENVSITAVERADLVLSLTPNSTTIDRGDSVTLTARVANHGPSPSTGTTLALEIPAGLTIQTVTPSVGTCSQGAAAIDCAFGTLAVNDEVTVNVQLLGATAGSYGITGQVDGQGLDNGDDQSGFASIVVRAMGDVSVSLAESADPVALEETFSYTATLRHVSGDSGSVQLDVPITGARVLSAISTSAICAVNGGDVSCNVGVLAAGATASVTIHLNAMLPGIATANATATYAGRDTNPANNTAAIGTTLRTVGDVSVEISDNADPVAVDAPYAYTVTLRNGGPNAGAVQVAIPVNNATVTGATSSSASCSHTATSATCDVTSLAGGGTAAINVTVIGITPGTASASATATFAGVDTNAANNSATASTVVRLVGDLSVEITDSVDPANVDAAFDYVVTTRNAGPNAGPVQVVISVLDATVNAVASPGAACTRTANSVTCDIASLPNGGSNVINVSVASAVAGTASALATATYAGVDTNTANNRDMAGTLVRRVGDVSVTVTDSADPVTNGTAYSYAVTVLNGGPNAGPVSVSVPVTGAAVVSATMNGGTCTNTATSVTCDIPSLASAAPAVITINVSATTAGSASAAATATFSGTDPNAANNTATANTTVNAPPAPPPGPPTAPRSSGGGGSFDWLFVGLLGLLLALRQSRRWWG